MKRRKRAAVRTRDRVTELKPAVRNLLTLEGFKWRRSVWPGYSQEWEISRRNHPFQLAGSAVIVHIHCNAMTLSVRESIEEWRYLHSHEHDPF